MIAIKVDGQIVSVQDTEPLYVGAVDVQKCHFTFDKSWHPFSKTAVFRVGATTHTELVDENDCCMLPWELLTRKHIGRQLEVGVYGVSADTEIMTSVWDTLGMVREGSEPGKDARNPADGIYEQIMAKLQRTNEALGIYDEGMQALVQRTETAAQLASESATTATQALDEVRALLENSGGIGTPSTPSAPEIPYCIEYGTLAYSSDTTQSLPFYFSQSYTDVPVFIPYVNHDGLTLQVEPLQSEVGYYGGTVTVTNRSGENISAIVAISAYCSHPTNGGTSGGHGGVVGDSCVGVGIQTIVRTDGDGSPGSVDTYTIILTDRTTYTFTVYNGSDGVTGKTAFQYAVEGGYAGTEEEFSEKLATDYSESAMTMATTANQKVDELREVASKLHSNMMVVEKDADDIISVSDSSDMELVGLRLFGKTTQDGTPSLDNPVPLLSVGQGKKINAYFYGKNLANVTSVSVRGDAAIENNNGYIRIYSKKAGTYQGIVLGSRRMVAGRTYVLSLKVDTIVGGTLSFGLRDEGNTFISRKQITSTGRYSISYTPKSDIIASASVLITYSESTIGDATFSEIQMEVSNSVTQYEPYYNMQTLTYQTTNGLPGIPVTTNGTYTDAGGQQWICDEVNYGRGVHIQRVGRIESYAGEEISSVFLSTTGELSDGATVLYALSVPIETPLSEEKMAVFLALHTNKPHTTAYNDSGTHMEMEYIADTKTYIDNKFTALQNAILSAGASV